MLRELQSTPVMTAGKERNYIVHIQAKTVCILSTVHPDVKHQHRNPERFSDPRFADVQYAIHPTCLTWLPPVTIVISEMPICSLKYNTVQMGKCISATDLSAGVA